MSKPEAVSAYYDVLADVYDDIKATDNYELWIGLLISLINQSPVGGKRLLDVGCGTGKGSAIFASHGFDVTGCDGSEAMLRIAKLRGGPAVRYLHADMRQLPSTLSDFNIAIWMGDVANHLLTAEDLTAALRSTAQALTPDGTILFDVNTLATYRTTFREHDVMDRGDVVLTWIGRTEKATPDGLAHADLSAFRRAADNTWRRSRGNVVERHHSSRTIQDALRDAGFCPVTAVALHRRELISPPDEDLHGKIIHVARKL